MEDKIVLAVVKNKEKVLMGRVKDEMLKEFGGIKYVFPGGRLKEGEAPEQAVVRKTKEETGLSVEVVTKLHSRKHPVTEKDIDYFLCKTTGSLVVTISTLTEDLSSVIWTPIATLKEFMPTISDELFTTLQGLDD
ncbi:MAG TPA: NUDIX hydrolase [bacterium]|nr:NUDIX hydrolase [bacterium]